MTEDRSFMEASAKELAVHLGLERDEDDVRAPRVRRAYLDRVAALREFTYRRDTWPIRAIGVSVGPNGEWRVRIVSLVLDRDTLKVGCTASEHVTDECDPQPPPGTLYHRAALRDSLMTAVHQALVEHFAHEAAEGLYYKGERLLDPHTESR